MPAERILGLDIGTASIGFALIDYDHDTHSGNIIRTGVRIFPETREGKTEVPLNHQRRTKRLIRRQVRRRKQRRRDLNELLALHKLLPAYGSTEWDEVMKKDPYELRVKGLSTKLEKYEIGRALYHLSKRRHFQGRECEIDEDPTEKEEKSTLKSRDNVVKKLERTGQTLGELLSNKDPNERKRNVQATREVVKKEFDRLIGKQASFYSREELNLVDLADQVKTIIFDQKPVFWRRNTLSKCKYEPTNSQLLCPSDSWLAHQKKMLENINNITIVGNDEHLNKEERSALIEAASGKDHLTWKAVRKVLAPFNEEIDIDELEFNLERGGLRKLPGNPIEKNLRKIFGKTWNEHHSRDKIRMEIHQELFECDYEDINKQRVVILRKETRNKNRKLLVQKLIKKYSIGQQEAQCLSKLEFKNGWEPFSIPVMRKFIAKLEEGHQMGALENSPHHSDWRQAAFPNRATVHSGSMKQLPSPRIEIERERLKSIRNPTVVRCQNELRKVVNNLLREYGRPDIIRIELARDLRNSKKKRLEIKKSNDRNAKIKEKAKEDLREKNVNPTPKAVEKWILWKECRCRCPYTGESIAFNELFGSNPLFDIEHIWPRSRWPEDSLANKTLCLNSANREKGNRTPYEFYGDEESKWSHFKRRVDKLLKKDDDDFGGMPYSKIKRLKQKEIPDDDFVNRQLVDTSYASREAIENLSRLYPPLEKNKRVYGVSGRATARLRRLWGLNSILDGTDHKTRNDHRHHAVDAFVVACIHPDRIQAILKDYYTIDHHQSKKKKLNPPWSGVRQELEKHIEKLVVSHKVTSKVSGALHEETIFGFTGKESIKEKNKVIKQYVVRKNIDSLSKTDRESIRDNHIRQLYSRATGEERHKLTLGKSKRKIRKVRLLKDIAESVLPMTTGFVKAGSNHHMAVYRNAIGKIEIDVVTLFEVAGRIKKRQPIIDKDKSNLQFLFSLSRNDSIEILGGEKKGIWIVKTLVAIGRIGLEKHYDAKGNQYRPFVKSLDEKFGFRKIGVDPIGIIRGSNS